MVVFIESGLAVLRWTAIRPSFRGYTRTAHHALASAAILCFPAVRVSTRLRRRRAPLTPLMPALRLARSRAKVALRQNLQQASGRHSRSSAWGTGPLFLFGKVLNALLLDHIDTDLAHARDERDHGGRRKVWTS
jgi:hypothetical protein